MDKNNKFCKHCGQTIDVDCIICPKCGKQVEELKANKDNPIIINNSASSSSSSSAGAAASASSGTRKVRKRHNFLLDLILILLTGGLWIIWMIVRPKYEYI